MYLEARRKAENIYREMHKQKDTAFLYAFWKDKEI